MKIQKLVCLIVLFSTTTVHADICAEMSAATSGAVSKRQQEIDTDPWLEEISQQRQRDQECMLNLSKELGGVVSADGYGLGSIIDDVFKRISSAVCNVQNNPARQYAGFTGSKSKIPEQILVPSHPPPSISGSQPTSSITTPPIIHQPPASSPSNVWNRLNEAMAGRPTSNK